MFFLFLIPLHVHIKRLYSAIYIHTQYFNCSVVLGGFTSAKGHDSTLIFKVNSSLQEVVEIIDIKYPLTY